MSNAATAAGDHSRRRMSRARPLGGARKRVLDIVVASTALVLLSPLIIYIAGFILLVDGRPVIYRHRRIGYGGSPFWCFKFRTMSTDADRVLNSYLEQNPEAAREWRTKQKLRADPRITWFGATLRKYSWDELPQLFNVLKGEMSCVGPRPITSEETSRYGTQFDEYARTRPGLTGAWQVNGRSETDYEQRVSLDCGYVREWSLQRDVRILMRTAIVVMRARGSY